MGALTAMSGAWAGIGQDAWSPGRHVSVPVCSGLLAVLSQREHALHSTSLKPCHSALPGQLTALREEVKRAKAAADKASSKVQSWSRYQT